MPHRRTLTRCLAILALLAVSTSVRGQSSDAAMTQRDGAATAQRGAWQSQSGASQAQPVTDADASTIFPSVSSVSSKARPLSTAWSEPNVKQPSPTRKTIFEQPDPAADASSQQGGVPLGQLGGGVPVAQPVLSSSAAGASVDQSMPGEECCPQCGRPLDHPILGSCDHCGPVRRLLYLLSPSHVSADHPQGSPVYHEPWINRPFSVGVFVGPIVGSPLINDWVGQQTGTLAGMRFGWDLDDDYGLELRMATANIQIYDEDPAYEAQLAQTTAGLSLPYLAGNRNADQFLLDIDFLYYPWGDAHFRPYLLFGIGTDRIKFTDRLGTNYARILLGIPVGVGFKTHLNDWLIFRVELTDNIALAGGSIFQTQQNFSATGAFEVRLGRTRMQYWPWNPGR